MLKMIAIFFLETIITIDVTKFRILVVWNDLYFKVDLGDFAPVLLYFTNENGNATNNGEALVLSQNIQKCALKRNEFTFHFILNLTNPIKSIIHHISQVSSSHPYWCNDRDS